MAKTNDKFTNYDDAQLVELRKIITESVNFMREKLAPALDLVLPSTTEKLVNQFLLEKRAEFLADEQAIREGYESLSDKYFQIEKERKQKEAGEKAKADALAKAQFEAEQQALEEQLQREKELKEARDKEDAENAARAKAELKAAQMGMVQAETSL